MNTNNKIAIVSTSLGIGGAERFAGLLSYVLDDLGYEVHHIIILDKTDYKYKGKLSNLGKMFKGKSVFVRGIKKGRYIAEYLKQNDIQTIIDNRSRPMLLREIFTKRIYGTRKIYYMIHSAKLEMYLPKSISWAKYLYIKAAKLVCVSKGIQQKVIDKYHFTNTTTLYNPVYFPEKTLNKPSDVPEKYILYFGRLDEAVKNFTLLLNAFALSEVYKTGTHLVIAGNGPDKKIIINKIKELQLQEFVTVIRFQIEITPYIQHAHCTILTSRFEGFPMSITESLAAGTPVISVDCETGPGEIIQDRHNGLLVDNHNEDKLATAIKSMVHDKVLYETCKNNAMKSVEHLSLANLAKQWQQLLTEK